MLAFLSHSWTFAMAGIKLHTWMSNSCSWAKAPTVTAASRWRGRCWRDPVRYRYIGISGCHSSLVAWRHRNAAEIHDDHDSSMFLRRCGDTTFWQANGAVRLSLRRLPSRTWKSLPMQLVPGTGCFSRAGRDRYLHSEDESSYEMQTLRNISLR
jgi:hypothetical protein